VAPEPGSDAALDLLEQWGPHAELWVPDLFFAECANALRHKAVYGPVSPEDAQQMLQGLLQIEYQRVSGWDVAEEALDLALRTGLTVWDACYLVVARRVEADLWTADKTLYEHGSRAHAAVRLLG